jgi:hypothetical protein
MGGNRSGTKVEDEADGHGYSKRGENKKNPSRLDHKLAYQGNGFAPLL